MKSTRREFIVGSTAAIAAVSTVAWLVTRIHGNFTVHIALGWFWVTNIDTGAMHRFSQESFMVKYPLTLAAESGEPVQLKGEIIDGEFHVDFLSYEYRSKETNRVTRHTIKATS